MIPLAKPIYGSITSLDGYVADATGSFDWATPDDEVHAFINDLERPIGTYLYGRRLYETMAGWESAPSTEGKATVASDYARIWRSANKIVFSRTLREAVTANTRIERSFAAAAVVRLKETSASDLTIGGPHLAAEAFKAGIVDEIRFFIAPVVVGGGNCALPAGLRIHLSLLAQRRFSGGFTYVHYSC